MINKIDIKCPECEKDTLPITTELVEDGVKIKALKCINCGYILTSEQFDKIITGFSTIKNNHT